MYVVVGQNELDICLRDLTLSHLIAGVSGVRESFAEAGRATGRIFHVTPFTLYVMVLSTAPLGCQP